MWEPGAAVRSEVGAELSRRELLQRAGTLGLGAAVLSALPLLEKMALPRPAYAADPILTDGTLQAYFDTIIPGRPATLTDLGNPIHSLAIAGVDTEPGAVEADALLLGQHPKIGFTALAAALLGELEARALAQGGPFITLDYAARERVLLGGLDYENPSRLLWEAGAAVPFTAFCAAATQVNPTSATASGYKVLGHPGVAPHGYRDFSFRRKLARERTSRGSLP